MLLLPVAILFVSADIGGLRLPLCSVGELRRSPGYQWSVKRIAGFVDSADVIVRAKAVALDSVAATYRDSTRWWPGVRFEITELLRGPRPARLVLSGVVVDVDDFNELPVPYQMVRRAGQRGECYASDYRLGAEYLLLLKDGRYFGLNTRWAPLAPLNEQVRGVEDAWLHWVRGRL